MKRDITKIQTIFTRPALRLPKLIALAVLVDHIRETLKVGVEEALESVMIEMRPESLQPEGPQYYNLDCKSNGYREREKETEVEVVMEDFNIPETPVRKEIIQLVADHNERNTKTPGNQRGKVKRSTRNILNRWHGSVGFLSGSAYELVYEVNQGNWRWTQQLATDDEGNFKYDSTTGKPILVRKAQREGIDKAKLMWMYISLVETFMAARKTRNEGTGAKWNDGENLKTIKNLLGAVFQGKRVLSGGFNPFTLSRYIQDLYILGYPVREIQKRVQPWFRIWALAEQCIEEAADAKPDLKFTVPSLTTEGVGVAFDFLPFASTGVDNPLVHQSWIDNNLANVIVRRKSSGHFAIFCKEVREKSIETLLTALRMEEENLIKAAQTRARHAATLGTQKEEDKQILKLNPRLAAADTWFYEGGIVINNGSHSRLDTPLSRISLEKVCQVVGQTLRMISHTELPPEKFAPPVRKEQLSSV